MTACNCPVPPDVSELSAADIDRIIGKPLCCTSCGHELELRCPEGHVHQAPRTKSPNDRPAPPPTTAEAWRECPSCKARFVPRPFQRRCDDCTPKKGTIGARVYHEKLCTVCRAPFVPTGPRALRCTTCRGVTE